jgi:hypothetical protein
MHALMDYTAFSGKAVLRPNLFYMNQGTLAFAEHEVLQCGKLDEVVKIVHVLLPEITKYAVYSAMLLPIIGVQ